MPTDLECCIETLIAIFHRYAIQDGDIRTLTKKELKKLIETELPNFNIVSVFHKSQSPSMKCTFTWK